MRFLGAVKMTVIRTAPGTHSLTGHFTPGAETRSEIRGSIQPLSGKTLEMLTETERNLARFTVITRDALYTNQDSNGTVADSMEIDGKRYRVIAVKPWLNGLINHHTAIVGDVQ